MKKPYTPPARHRWFDDWMGARGPALKQLVADITAQVEAVERETGARKRQRKVMDQRHFEVAVEAVVSNLAYEVLSPSETGRLAFLSGNGRFGFSRYDNKALGAPFRTLLGRLDVLRLVDWQYPATWREASSLAPTEVLRQRVASAGIVQPDFGRIDGEETIILSRKVRLSSASDAAPSRQLVDYADTPQTVALRASMVALNEFLEAADISFVDDGEGRVDAGARVMSRYFVDRAGQDEDELPTFDQGGRLFGGFWQNLKSDRRRGIRINGEPVADLDYGQMAARLAYASVGAIPPEGDIYAIPGLEGHRGGVKKALNCLLFDSHRRRSWPAEFVEEEGADPSDLLPRGWTVKRTKAAILARHPALAPCLGEGRGFALMHSESEVLVSVLQVMMDRGIVGLGIHDALLVQASKAEEVRAIMEGVALSQASAIIPVSVNRLSV